MIKSVDKSLSKDLMCYQNPHSTGEMVYTTEGDLMVLYLGILPPALIALLGGLVIHSFIIVINVTDWLNGRSVTPVDHIITSLGISRICNQCANTLHLLVLTLFLSNRDSRLTLVLMDAFHSFFAYTNVWLTSLLSIVFCLKISNLRTRLFLYLRRMIDQRTVHFIVGSVLLSAINCLFPLLTAISKFTKSGTYNATIDNLFKECSVIKRIYTYTIGASIPMLFFSFSSILLFTSLYRHITKMKMSGNLSINLETYYSAMTFVSITFMYQTLYFTGDAISVMYYNYYCVRLLWLHIAMGFLPVLHSSYLIYRTAKLRSHMSKVLQNVIDFLFQRKETEIREDIELVG
ncbi:taste receptor type 2 member 9-like [Hyla sarda]|uniref:taste receptor type 2 member 9-like n=1 Tax=Hyla sarda TaxID=327740 RepID=UPI0024C4376B|nr:taste receptor type 2 member 9-like [Hyla sarda]